MELKIIIGAYQDLLEQNYMLSDVCGVDIFEKILSSKLDNIYLENNSQNFLSNNLFIYLINLDKKQIEIYYQYANNKLPEDKQPSIFAFVQKQKDLDDYQDVKLLNIFDFSDVTNNDANQLVNDLYKLIG